MEKVTDNKRHIMVANIISNEQTGVMNTGRDEYSTKTYIGLKYWFNNIEIGVSEQSTKTFDVSNYWFRSRGIAIPLDALVSYANYRLYQNKESWCI